MPAAGKDDEFLPGDAEHEPVRGVDADAPPTRQIAAQGFGLSDATVAVALDVADELVDAAEGLAVLALPPLVIRPCAVVPALIHRGAMYKIDNHL